MFKTELNTATFSRSPTTALVEQTDFYRLDAGRFVNLEHRSQLGQFLTPASVSRFMAHLSEPCAEDVHLLDPGAGVGSLSAAWVEEILRRDAKPRSIRLTACEIDPKLSQYLHQTLTACGTACRKNGVQFKADIIEGDFLSTAVQWLSPSTLFSSQRRTFNCAILNPPYRKINSDSDARRLLREVGIETTNLYTAFLWLVVKLLDHNGEMVAITPRSFCNGPYFRPFREALLAEAHISRIHVFDSRKTAFRDDDVLQENVIFRVTKAPTGKQSLISTSHGPDDSDIAFREVGSHELVSPDDPDHVIHIVPNELQNRVAQRIKDFSSTLTDLGIQVSTGRVVDFRAKEFLIHDRVGLSRDHTMAPLIYPMHFEDGLIQWPRVGKKANYLRVSDETKSLLVPPGVYVLVKRFSAKEEKRRVTAAVCHPDRLPKIGFAFENHLNYYHDDGHGLSLPVARGLAAYLNSSLVDSYFRQFSGHTQVNASDLRSLPYPDGNTLHQIGQSIDDSPMSQEQIDQLIAKELSDVTQNAPDPLHARRRIDEAVAILKLLGLPRAQQNDRSALTLLALVDMRPATSWADASSPLVGITPIMDFAKEHYGTTYAPNTRETFRRQTMHQFVEAGIALYNPDKPNRPVNSPKAVYQIVPLLLDVLRAHGTDKWQRLLKDWLAAVPTLTARYARERQMAKIPLKLPTGEQIELSPGGQNVLIEQIIHEFCPRFIPGGAPIYVGDTEEK
jgi:adenine-specific DNA-methyltransferase